MVKNILTITLSTIALSSILSFTPLFFSSSVDAKTTTTTTHKDKGTTVVEDDDETLIFKDGTTISKKDYGTCNQLKS